MGAEDILNYAYLALGFLGGFATEFALSIFSKHYEEHRDRVQQRTLLRGDLKARLNNFRDAWEDSECMIPYTDLREDLIKMMKEIRESINDEPAQFPGEVKIVLRQASIDFFQVAKKYPRDDEVWCKNVKKEMDEICRKLKSVEMKLN